MQTISLRLPDEMVEELDRAAKAQHVTKSALVRASIEKTLRPQSTNAQSCYDLVSDLVGSIKGTPKDLATNPKYFEGFGK
ncbi:MAG: ribbon-helix-helix domain-containing protein [Acidobacteriota bacterium]